MIAKHLLKSIFIKVTDYNFSKLSQHFKKMADSFWQILQTHSETCICCLKRYISFQKQSVGGALKVLAKSLKTVFDEVHFIANLLYQNLIEKYEDYLER